MASNGSSNDGAHDAGLIGPGGKVDREALYALYERQDDDDDSPITVQFKLSRDLKKRLDKYLVDRIPFLSRTSLQRLIREKAVHVNGRVPKASTRLRAGDEIIAVLPPPPSKEIPAENIPLKVLYEDDDLIVINKSDDMIVHPARGNRSGTIINALAWHFRHHSSGELSSVGEEFARPGVVHRLDRHTTGVMVAAKTDTAHWRLGQQFEQRTPEKRYLAVVHGRLEPYADVIDMPLGKHPTAREKYAVRWDETGKPSVTIYRVREVYENYTLVELELKSGRTHQIRVHLSHLGYPIVGDDMYGGQHVRLKDILLTAGESPPQASDEITLTKPLITRQALHATMLGFTHPTKRKPMQFQAPVPEDMQILIHFLRKHCLKERPVVSGVRIDLAQVLGRSDDAAHPMHALDSNNANDVDS